MSGSGVLLEMGIVASSSGNESRDFLSLLHDHMMLIKQFIALSAVPQL
jgi:hypothetical protein